MTNDLVTWLRAQLDDDERVAREAARDQPGQWRVERTPGGTHKVVDVLGYSVVEHADVDSEPWFTTPHIARHDPARVLAEVDAKRRILAEYERYAAERRRLMNGWESSREVSPILAALALPYADRPGYRDEWRPE